VPERYVPVAKGAVLYDATDGGEDYELLFTVGGRNIQQLMGDFEAKFGKPLYIIGSIIKRGINTGFLICMSLILAGATGNIIDCLFYGMIFNNPPAPIVAEFVPFGSGYASMFYGKVVDMFYFPLVEWNWPSWLPYIGGEHFIFFSPIFNFADACISCSVIYMLLFYRKQLQNIMK
jgi:lipoprotein signal peptidase